MPTHQQQSNHRQFPGIHLVVYILYNLRLQRDTPAGVSSLAREEATQTVKSQKAFQLQMRSKKLIGERTRLFKIISKPYSSSEYLPLLDYKTKLRLNAPAPVRHKQNPSFQDRYGTLFFIASALTRQENKITTERTGVSS